MAMSKEWKASVRKALREYNIRHRCTTQHGFIRNSAVKLAGIPHLPADQRAEVMGCISGVPLIYSSLGWATNDYALMFVWDQPVEKVLHAAATLQMRCNAGATLCTVYVAKAVRDMVTTPEHDMWATWVGQTPTPRQGVARFLIYALKENIDV